MVSGRSSSGRGGGDDEKDEAAKRRSDAARLRGSYRYTKYGLSPSPVFYRRESSFSRRGASHSSRSSSASASTSRVPPLPVKMEIEDASTSRVPPLPVKMEIEDTVVPGFAPGDYVEDADLDKVVTQLEKKAGFTSGDFVDDNHLPTILGLVSETSRREADKAEEWRLVAQEQGKVYQDLDTDEE